MEKILDCLAIGRSEKSYDEDVRAFGLTLHFYSPRAYNYVRDKFNNNLPCISTIRNWYSSLNASPGFTTESFDVLRKRANENVSSKLYCNLMCDEMAIRRHAQWNSSKNKFDGFVDIGRTSENEDNLPLAKDALVYLISGIVNDFKIPIGYFLTNGLNGHERAALLNEALIRLNEIGVEVICITFDGLPANFTMCRLLGADFDSGKGYISDPVQPQRKIYVILDPPHMLKLTRNCIGTRNLIDSDGGVIQWKYIRMVYEAQKSLPWNLGNKLTKSHMEWDRKKLSVRLAAETLSNSVADSMEFLKQECDEFKHVDATVKFIRIINDIFDIMNSTKTIGSIGFKRPISKSTYQELFQRFDEAITYLSGLKVEHEKKTIFSSTVHTPFIGFFINMFNLKSIFEQYVLTEKFDILVTHRFSQDLLESFFGSIRSMGGKIII